MNRILVVGCLPGTNGIMTCICNLLKHLDRTRFDWEFLVMQSSVDSGLGFAALEALNVRIHSLNYSRTHFPRAARRHLKDLMLSIPDLRGVHLHDSGCLNVYPLHLARQLHLPIRMIQIHSQAGAYSAAATLPPHSLAARRHLISDDSVDRLACSLQAGQTVYRDLSFSLFPNATDLDRFSFNPVYRKIVREKLGIPESATVIGFPGHFWPVKNPLFAIEVFEAYHKLQPDSYLLLLGDGALRNTAYQMCVESQLLPFTRFLGFRSDIELFLNAMDLIINTSFSEGLPNVLVEAQATGLPCLVSDGMSREIQLTNLCAQISLASPPLTWAKKIAAILDRRAPRRSYRDELKAKGYDIIDSINSLTTYYNYRL